MVKKHCMPLCVILIRTYCIIILIRFELEVNREISPFVKPLNKAQFHGVTARATAEATANSSHTVTSEHTVEEVNGRNYSIIKPPLNVLDLYRV